MPVERSVYLAFGARDGDPETQLEQGILRLRRSGVRPAAISSLWETEPVGIPGPNPVLNAALQAKTRLSPRALLDLCRSVEDQAGRRRTAPERRTLDVDILLYDDLVLDEPDLTIPHPRFASRRFNLAPLAEIAPDRIHPVLRRTVRELLDGCEDPSWVRVKAAEWGERFVERTDRIR